MNYFTAIPQIIQYYRIDILYKPFHKCKQTKHKKQLTEHLYYLELIQVRLFCTSKTQPLRTATAGLLHTRCPSCHPANSVMALKEKHIKLVYTLNPAQRTMYDSEKNSSVIV